MFHLHKAKWNFPCYHQFFPPPIAFQFTDDLAAVRVMGLLTSGRIRPGRKEKLALSLIECQNGLKLNSAFGVARLQTVPEI